MNNLLDKIEKIRLVPVVKLDDAKDALPLGQALMDGGLPIAEITFRTNAAEESIRIIKKNFPEMILGAGTVINSDQAKRAQGAGATFIVSPGISRSVIEFALDNNLAILPGACTPTEIMTAMEYNLSVVKFFPAEQYGGLDTIKALAAPFPGVRFMPTGGVNASNILEYLSFNKIIACGGSWMVKDSLIKEKKFSEITELIKEAVTLISDR